jgi:hypothetical protein
MGNRSMRGKIFIPAVFLLSLLIISAGCIRGDQPAVDPGTTIEGEIRDTAPQDDGTMVIEGVGSFRYRSADIRTMRTDIFRERYFSVFDILVHLNRTRQIDLVYHFDDSLDTYVIDSLNGMQGWWYIAFYDGGWAENNVQRMDQYPVKDRMVIRIIRMDLQRVASIHDVFHREVGRLDANNRTVIIPLVTIRGERFTMTRENVLVTPHNLRQDIFQPDVVTAVDVLMSLADQKAFTYSLAWYDSVGSADIYRSFVVERIGTDRLEGRCGFVYETGDRVFYGSGGNHIHIPPDTRIIVSPEYSEWFWICL